MSNALLNHLSEVGAVSADPKALHFVHVMKCTSDEAFLRRFGAGGCDRLRIPDHSGHLFRSIPDTHSGPFRTPVPDESGHSKEAA